MSAIGWSWPAVGLLAIVIGRHAAGGKPGWAATGWGSVTLGSILSLVHACAHFAAPLLLPVVLPMCSAGSTGHALSASGSLLARLGGVGLHTVTMLATTGALAEGARRCVEAFAARFRSLPVEAPPWRRVGSQELPMARRV